MVDWGFGSADEALNKMNLQDRKTELVECWEVEDFELNTLYNEPGQLFRFLSLHRIF